MRRFMFTVAGLLVAVTAHAGGIQGGGTGPIWDHLSGISDKADTGLVVFEFMETEEMGQEWEAFGSTGTTLASQTLTTTSVLDNREGHVAMVLISWGADFSDSVTMTVRSHANTDLNSSYAVDLDAETEAANDTVFAQIVDNSTNSIALPLTTRAGAPFWAPYLSFAFYKTNTGSLAEFKVKYWYRRER